MLEGALGRTQWRIKSDEPGSARRFGTTQGHLPGFMVNRDDDIEADREARIIRQRRCRWICKSLLIETRHSVWSRVEQPEPKLV